jgi:hypothetical protein
MSPRQAQSHDKERMSRLLIAASQRIVGAASLFSARECKYRLSVRFTNALYYENLKMRTIVPKTLRRGLFRVGNSALAMLRSRSP